MSDNEQLLQAERAVIGDLVAVPARARDVAAIITPGDFYDIRLGALYGLILGMVTSSGPGTVTALTITDEVRRRRTEQTTKGTKGILWPSVADVGGLIGGIYSGIPEAHARLIRKAAIARDITALGQRLIGAAEAGEDPSALAVRAVEEAKAIRDGARGQGMLVEVLADVFAEEDPGYDWLIPGLLERRDRLVYTGAEGAGKSTFGRQLALCGAGGVHPFTPQRFEPIRVTVIDCENSRKQWKRKARAISISVKQLTGIDPAETVHLACPGRLDITKPDGLGAVHSVLDDYPTDLLLIGPLYKLVPFAITNDSDAAPLLAGLDSLRERPDGPALMMEAHAGHALGKGGERDYRPRGSAALLGWPEFGFGFAPDLNVAERIDVIRWRGDRDERAWPKAMRRGGHLPWTNDELEPGKDPHKQPYQLHEVPDTLDGAA